MHTKRHFRETERLVRQIPRDEIARWLLNEGYFPERNILPPSFQVHNFKLRSEPYYKNVKKLPRQQLATISFPKSRLTSRTFAVIHPKNYHDAVYYLHQNWDAVVEHLFHPDLRIFSYSFPVPVTTRSPGQLGRLRAGRLIYEWVTMAERHLVADAGAFTYILRTDITNFYQSIYTHSIAWALHGRDKAFQDKGYQLFGNKIDRVMQYANDARTNGIPIGPALCDLLAEIILARVDREVSDRCRSLKFVATRFKDDYRVLFRSKTEANQFLSVMVDVLAFYNLTLNENKTTIEELPHGLYRLHDRRYSIYSLRSRSTVSFKEFEYTLLAVLDIHREFPGTSVIEKFLSELLTHGKDRLKIKFSPKYKNRRLEIKKTIELLFFLRRESPKVTNHVLALCQLLYDQYISEFGDLKSYLAEVIERELQSANEHGSAFETVWYFFFARFMNLELDNIGKLIQNGLIQENKFYQVMRHGGKCLFGGHGTKASFCVEPTDLRGRTLAQHIAVFD